jgi:ParB family transcriptional regulator, chromosome partitioning protein
MKEPVQLIPIERIRILNPRHRDRAKFQAIVESIKALGVKKPVQINARSDEDGSYDLICGQGRIEACRILGFTEIPAIIVNVSKEDRLLRSLVENLARRFPDTSDLINEIERLKNLGYSNVQIGKKLDICDSHIGELITLKQNGEENLLNAAIRGKIPVGVAVDIAKTKSVEDQRELLKAYQAKKLNQASIRIVRRLLDHRRFIGKAVRGKSASKQKTSADSMVSAYKREAQRQKMIVRKARVCDAKLTLLTQAFTKLMADENFLNLLRAEGLSTMPQFLSDKIHLHIPNAA